MLFTSVPVSSMPASNSSSHSYSWRARRLSTVGVGAGSFFLAGVAASALGLGAATEITKTAARVDASPRYETARAQGQQRPRSVVDAGFNREDLAPLPRDSAAHNERLLRRNRLTEAHLQLRGDPEEAECARCVRHRLVEQQRDDPAVHDVAPALKPSRHRDAALDRTVVVQRKAHA